MTNNPNTSLLWRFTVWKQYFSRQIVCIHATHTHTHTYTTHTTHTWSHTNARVRENRFRRKKKGMHPRDFIKYIFFCFVPYIRWRNWSSILSFRLFFWKKHLVSFFSFLFFFFLFSPCVSRNCVKFQKRLKVKKKSTSHVRMFNLLSEGKQFRAKNVF